MAENLRFTSLHHSLAKQRYVHELSTFVLSQHTVAIFVHCFEKIFAFYALLNIFERSDDLNLKH